MRPAAHILEGRFRSELADVLEGLGGTGRDAVRSLLRSGFDGTVAELFDVA